ncbi:MAG: hypothetical protein CMP86_00485 [Gammaproteobacteria bacterium]|nr:hypothetical protein [Gammaproteobacteria bacterium]
MLGRGRPPEGRPEDDDLGAELEGPPAEPLGLELEELPEELLGLEELGCEFEGAPDELLGLWGVGICGCGNGVMGAQPKRASRPANATTDNLFTIPPSHGA